MPTMPYIPRFTIAALAALFTAGCLTYGPTELSGMSSFDICELRVNQGMNLSAETKRAVQDELQRRNDDCRSHAALIAERREERLNRDVYGQPNDP